MQPIHVKRYQNPCGYQGSIEPEDRSWLVFVDDQGQATFWRRVEVKEATADAPAEHAYCDAELPVLSASIGRMPEPAPMDTGEACALDYTVTQEADGFHATLNARSISGVGATEHEAVQRLLNYVAKLCTAGSLDHTGAPSNGNPRRHAYVWPNEA